MTVYKSQQDIALKQAHDLLQDYSARVGSNGFELKALLSNPVRLIARSGNACAELTLEFQEDGSRPYRVGDTNPEIYPKVRVNIPIPYMDPNDATALAPLLGIVGAAGNLLLEWFKE